MNIIEQLYLRPTGNSRRSEPPKGWGNSPQKKQIQSLMPADAFGCIHIQIQNGAYRAEYLCRRSPKNPFTV